MAKFWLATFDLGPWAPGANPAAAPLAVSAAAWAIEIIADETNDDRLVLLSTVDDRDAPGRFCCRIGFANHAERCNRWRDGGFPLLDAAIEWQDGTLRVACPCFHAVGAMNYAAEVLTLRGLYSPLAGAGAALPAGEYRQTLQLPDVVFPATRLAGRPVTWSPQRHAVEPLDPTALQLCVTAPRYPDLRPFGARQTPHAAWSGEVTLPDQPPPPRPGPAARADRDAYFGVPDFRFEAVEVLGFRLDLARDGTDAAELSRLMERLNFHLPPNQPEVPDATHAATTDLRYRPATQTVMLELLRYGRMKLRRNTAPLEDADYQSQHELTVRLLTGRVDDDTAQARDAATYVPAVFVDNPWSKMLGRAVQGFDKRMAQFCVSDAGGAVPLRPDGCRPGHAVIAPLGSIAEVRLATRTTTPPLDSGQWLLRLDCPAEARAPLDRNDDIDVALAYRPFSFLPTRWRLSDFRAPAFRHAFARRAVAETLVGLRSIQVSPVGEAALQQALALDTAWVTGTFELDDGARLARPNAIANVTLRAEPAAPQGWLELCALCGIRAGQQRRISLPPGSWYRMSCSMDLLIDDGFGW